MSAVLVYCKWTLNQDDDDDDDDIVHEKTREQQHFTILEVAADCHELVIPWHGMQPSIARNSGQVDPRHITTDIPRRQSPTLGLHPIARRLLLINRPHRDGTLRWHWYTAAKSGFEPTTSERIHATLWYLS